MSKKIITSSSSYDEIKTIARAAAIEHYSNNKRNSYTAAKEYMKNLDNYSDAEVQSFMSTYDYTHYQLRERSKTQRKHIVEQYKNDMAKEDDQTKSR